MSIDLEEFQRAAERIEPYIHRISLDHSGSFSRITGGEIYFSCENMQRTGSYKIRGAANVILKWKENGNLRPIVTSSAGNLALAASYAAGKAGVPITVVMPEGSPVNNIEATEDYGADVRIQGLNPGEARGIAKKLAEDTGALYMHPYDDRELMVGQGTLGLDIISELPDVDMVVVPVGSGGLLAGLACALKQIRPDIQVIGVCDESTGFFEKEFRRLLNVEGDKGSLLRNLVMDYVDDVVVVSRAEVADGALKVLERCKMVVEPTSSTPVAAVLGGKIDVKGKKVVCVLGSGNVTPCTIRDIVDQGMLARHQRATYTISADNGKVSSDGLLHELAVFGSGVMEVQYITRKIWQVPGDYIMRIVCEVRNLEHAEKIKAHLISLGCDVELTV